MAVDGKVGNVVVDSGGFIRNAPLRDIGTDIYSITDVVTEIRDKATRQRLQVLPYELKFREPPPEAVKIVTDFAKKTGDYRSLSAVDIRLIALTYQLEKENIGTAHIKTEPEKKIVWNAVQRNLEKPTDIAGFYLGKKKSINSRTTSVSQDSGVDADDIIGRVSNVTLNDGAENSSVVTTSEGYDQGLRSTGVAANEGVQDNDACPSVPSSSHQGNDCTGDPCHIDPTQLEQCAGNKGSSGGGAENGEDGTENGEDGTENGEDGAENGENGGLESKWGGIRQGLQEGESIPADCLKEEEEDSEGEASSDEDDEDDDGWITPSNIKEVRRAMGDVNMDKATVAVGCLTTDFAMQNVLIQMGLNVISVDGLLIRRAKSYALRCFACMKVTTRMGEEFCPHCGNKTLTRVSMTVADDGSIQYFMSKRRPVNTRGLKYSLPQPQGGKHSKNPILCADQPGAQQRTAKAAKVKYDALDPDYLAHSSPFAPIDTTSRSALLGIRSHRQNFQKRRNPNENKKSYGRRK